MSAAIDRIIERLIYESLPEERIIACGNYTLADLIRDLREAGEEHDYEIREWQEEVHIALCVGERDDGLPGSEDPPTVSGRARGSAEDGEFGP